MSDAPRSNMAATDTGWRGKLRDPMVIAVNALLTYGVFPQMDFGFLKDRFPAVNPAKQTGLWALILSLAVACAADALERDAVKRIVLVRPAVEAGEKLGFLPGDLAQKVDPYLRPLYDALYDLMGFDRVGKAFEKGLIEIAPLAFMRGRTLNHAFIILDEAQNTTPEQMKMFLTRIGFGSKVVVTGDTTQIDVPDGRSGLFGLERTLTDIEGLAFVHLNAGDVVRHRIVADIVAAYERATPGTARG